MDAFPIMYAENPDFEGVFNSFKIGVVSMAFSSIICFLKEDL